MKKLLVIILLFCSANLVAQNPAFLIKGVAANAPTAPNLPPTANAGIDKAITLPTSSVSLFGTGSDDTGGLTYEWTQVSGPSTVTLTGDVGSGTSATLLAADLIEGTYVLLLTYTDVNSLTGTDTAEIVVNATAVTPPAVNAGANQNITLPTNTVTLSGTATDADGIASTLWILKTGPVTAVIESPTTLTTDIIFAEPGTYTFQLKAIDNLGAIAFDDVLVTVTAAATSDEGNYTIALDTISHVSAAVYTYDSSTLVKTLFSDSIIAAGTHILKWNGTDDIGNPIPFPATKYTIKVLTNNVQADWVGAQIGNNSDSLTGETKYRGYYYCMTGLAFTATDAYYSTGYSEGSPSIGKFNTLTPNTKIPLFTSTTQTGDNNFVATDDTLVYFGAYDSNSGNNTFAWALRTSDDDTAILANTINYKGVYHRTYPTIGYKNLTNSFITGLAVQKTGSLLFIARAGQDEIGVYNKRTAALVGTVTVDSARALAVDENNKLWVTTSTNTVNRYSVNSSTGALTLEITLSGLVSPLAIGAGGSLIAISDGGASQQVKFYNNVTGAATNTLGTAEGYQHQATVNNNKFFFGLRNFVSFQSDGTFWVNDFQNFRVQHYDASRVFVNRIMSLGAVYSITADPNATNRVFVGQSPPNTPQSLLEFDVDYVNNTSTLVKNWAGNIPSIFNLQYDIKFATLSNGRTYGLIPRSPVSEIIELSNTGDTARRTGITKNASRLTPEGNIMTFQRGSLGGVSIMRSYPLTGFLSGNPEWSATPTILFTTPTLTRDDPNSLPRTANSIITASKKAIMFDPSAAWTVVNNHITDAKTGAHLIAIDSGTNRARWKTLRGTHINYAGAIPDAGRFDVGNLVNDYGGGGQSIIDNYVLTSYHGEFWKNGQTNYYTIMNDNGLVISFFGTDRSIVGRGNHAAAMMAGNALTPQMIMGSDGNIYLIHGDESDHAAGHIWILTRLNTIRQQDIVVDNPTAYVPGDPNLMTGLPFDTTMPMSRAGWTRSHAQNTTDKFNSYYVVKTSTLTYNRQFTPDVFVQFVDRTAQTKTITRTLGTNNVTAGWTLSGQLAYPSNMPNGQNINQFLDVLDDAGKVLIRFYPKVDRSVNPFVASIMGNAETLVSGTEAGIKSIMNPYVPFEFKIVPSGITHVVTITYGSYTTTTTIFDGTADWHKPTTLRQSMISTASTQAVYTSTFDADKFIFVNLDAP